MRRKHDWRIQCHSPERAIAPQLQPSYSVLTNFHFIKICVNKQHIRMHCVCVRLPIKSTKDFVLNRITQYYFLSLYNPLKARIKIIRLIIRKSRQIEKQQKAHTITHRGSSQFFVKKINNEWRICIILLKSSAKMWNHEVIFYIRDSCLNSTHFFVNISKKTFRDCPQIILMTITFLSK